MSSCKTTHFLKSKKKKAHIRIREAGNLEVADKAEKAGLVQET